jgi:hypothetical protein
MRTQNERVFKQLVEYEGFVRPGAVDTTKRPGAKKQAPNQHRRHTTLLQLSRCSRHAAI